MNPSENKDLTLVPVYSAANEAEAAMVANAIQNEGIRTFNYGEFTSGFRAEAPGDVEVLVAAADESRARAVVEQYVQQAGSEVDWDQVDVGEPED